MMRRAVGPPARGSRKRTYTMHANKKLVFILCWSTYVVAYLCRINLSSVLTKLGQSQNIDAALLGAVGSCFFAVYALGQLINGYLGDRVSPYSFLALAMLGTAALNLLISLTSGFVPLLVLWSLNGIFQSMVWGPLMRILSLRFSSKEKIRVSTGMASSMGVGLMVSWAVFGRLFQNSPWQTYFWVPALFAFAYTALWAELARRQKRQGADQGAKGEAALAVSLAPSPGASLPRSAGSLPAVIRREKLWLIALVCMAMGIIKESLSLWAPFLLATVLGLEEGASFLLLAIIPVFNFVGILAMPVLLKAFASNVKKVMTVLFGVTVVCAAMLLLAGNALPGPVAVLPIAVVSGMMYGGNGMLLSFVPLCFAKENIVSSLVGLFDFSSYVGAAISSVALGLVISAGSYRAIFLVWALTAAAALLLIALMAKLRVRLAS